jgi:hypothetical protein
MPCLSVTLLLLFMAYFFDSSPWVGGLLGLCRGPLVQRAGAWALLLGFLPLGTGGCNYYRTQQQPAAAAELSKLADHKIFLVHEGSQVWQLLNPRLEGEMLVGTRLAGVDRLAKYLHPEPNVTTRRYLRRDAKAVLNLVHLYVAGSEAGPNEQVRIPVSRMQRLDIVEEDTGRTLASHVLVGVGAAAAALALLLVIIALTKSSCPFVYAYNGQQYQFVGETYSGAIFAPAERDDYLPLPTIEPIAGEYRVKISNELKERQHTNLAELVVVQHATASRVLLGRTGQVHTLRSLQPAQRATSGTGSDRTAQLRAADHDVFSFNDPTPGAQASTLTLSFDRPAGAQRGKLVLHARNTLWLDFLYGKFIEQFGSYYPTWAARQHDPATADNVHWAQEQQIPLRVYYETTHGWRLADAVPTVGPLASREVVVPLDFGPGPAGAPVRVKLETGFMFWEIDAAALDCSPDEAVQLDKCQLLNARTERGTDQRAALLADDAHYLRQLRPGTEVSLAYRSHLPAPRAGVRRTVFLHTKGYYEHIREFKGMPDLLALYRFRRPGHFVEFSKETYQQYAQQAPALALTSSPTKL